MSYGDDELAKIRLLDELYELARTFDTPEAWALYVTQRAEIDRALGMPETLRIVPLGAGRMTA